jgi:hypothetical protein
MEDSSENNQVGFNANSAQAQSYWLGITDLDGDGDFTNLDGEPLEFDSWFAGEPIEGQCAVIDSSTRSWNSVLCDRTNGVLCEPRE